MNPELLAPCGGGTIRQLVPFGRKPTTLTCHELFAGCQRTGETHIKEKDVESVLEDVVERSTVNLKFVWDEASDIEKWSLASLALMDGKSDNRALADCLHKQQCASANLN